MIERSEILEVATDLSLSADVVEKDYVLGWLLAGIYAHEELTDKWVFKGGTCLKKCYFETYRFSEDLDFTLTDSAQLSSEFLRAIFTQIAEWLYDEIGIEMPTDQLRFEVYKNKRGGMSAEGRIYYNGPLRRVSSLPRIKLDLTVDEVIVLPPVQRLVGHPYTDIPQGGIVARCYAYEEVFGEKIRAFGERTRPRDLYDVINLFRHGEFKPAAAVILNVLQQKCSFKGIPLPTLDRIAAVTDELVADWQTMLGHQLPALPPFGTFWNALPEFFAWLMGAGAPVTPSPLAPLGPGEEVFRPAVGFLRRQGFSGSSFIETIRFAAVNRLCVDLTYQGSVRRIEPYSLRRTTAGDILLFAVRSDSAEIRSYRLGRVQGAQVTSQSFVPRFFVELTPVELGAVQPLTRAAGMTTDFGGTLGSIGRRYTPITQRRVKTGPVYIYQCSYCQKKFRRSKRDSRLNEHKTPSGYSCPGRTGYLVDTKY
jgi:predicted nucleotidyltransferase component of viral defense system